MVESFSIVRSWKQAKYPTIGDKHTKLWHIHTIEYILKKRNILKDV